SAGAPRAGPPRPPARAPGPRPGHRMPPAPPVRPVRVRAGTATCRQSRQRRRRRAAGTGSGRSSSAVLDLEHGEERLLREIGRAHLLHPLLAGLLLLEQLLLARDVARSEEHTSELQSRENLVCRLLLEKKKIKS